MDRREFLAASVVSAGLFSGCQRISSDDSSDGPRSMWRYPGTIIVAGVGNGRVIGFNDEVKAIDAESGEIDWTFSEALEGAYTMPVINDAIYFGVSDDAGGSGYGELYAVTFDGEERWSVETGSVYTPPFVRDGVVYAAGDDGNVRAIDSADGAIHWETDLFPDSLPSTVDVIGVDDVVYASTGRLTALDRSDGSIRWQYGDELDFISRIAQTDEMVFVAIKDDLVALDDGEEVWRAGLDEGSKDLHGTAGDRVFVEQRDTLYAFDVANGEQQWTVDDFEALSLTERTAYVGTEAIQSVSVDTGDLRWETDLNSAVRSISVQSTAFDTTSDVSRHRETVSVNTERRLMTLNSEGMEEWERTFDEEVFDHLYDGLLYCRTSDAIYAFI